VKPQTKKEKVGKAFEVEEDADVCATPQIQPSTFYPPRGKALKTVEELPAATSIDPEELEARYARGKRVAEMIQK
jgi:hypothetical protein